ncbi:MAG TPA: type II secretion system F family protein [Anaerolineales bacterium]|nr:type II secretion system F family protein [Anaerolineales bacterium]
MNPEAVIQNLGLALSGACGAWLFLLGVVGLFSRPKASLSVGQAVAATYPVSDLPLLMQRVLGGLLHRLGRLLLRGQDPLRIEDQLRRSGWRYQSVGDYFASKVANAVMYLLVGLFALGQIFSGFLPVALALGLGVLGYLRPDEKIREALKLRKEGLKREMAWTLDRLAAVMQTGEALGPSLHRLTDANYDWVAGGGGGLFIAILRDISAGLASNRSDIGALIDEIRATLPEDVPELDEFLQLVRANLEKRQPVVEQLRALSVTMRDELNNRIEDLAQKAELRIVMVTSGVIVPLMLVVVGGVILLNLRSILPGG